MGGEADGDTPVIISAVDRLRLKGISNNLAVYCRSLCSTDGETIVEKLRLQMHLEDGLPPGGRVAPTLQLLLHLHQVYLQTTALHSRHLQLHAAAITSTNGREVSCQLAFIVTRAITAGCSRGGSKRPPQAQTKSPSARECHANKRSRDAIEELPSDAAKQNKTKNKTILVRVPGSRGTASSSRPHGLVGAGLVGAEAGQWRRN